MLPATYITTYRYSSTQIVASITTAAKRNLTRSHKMPHHAVQYGHILIPLMKYDRNTTIPLISSNRQSISVFNPFVFHPHPPPSRLTHLLSPHPPPLPSPTSSLPLPPPLPSPTSSLPSLHPPLPSPHSPPDQHHLDAWARGRDTSGCLYSFIESVMYTHTTPHHTTHTTPHHTTPHTPHHTHTL